MYSEKIITFVACAAIKSAVGLLEDGICISQNTDL